MDSNIGMGGNYLRDDYYPGDISFDPLGLKPEDAKVPHSHTTLLPHLCDSDPTLLLTLTMNISAPGVRGDADQGAAKRPPRYACCHGLHRPGARKRRADFGEPELNAGHRGMRPWGWH